MSFPEINFKTVWQPLVTCLAVIFLYAGVLSKLGHDWWTDENYSHGLLVPFVIGFIIWAEFDELKTLAGKPNFRLGFAVVLPALLLLLGGTLGAELFTQRISLALMLAGIVIYFFGAKILKMLAVPFTLLLLAIPIPQIIFNKIAFPLQIWASQMSVWGIRLFEIPTVRKGNVIEILPLGATQVIALEVVEACSGIRSLMTLLTLALVLAYFTREKRVGQAGPFWKNADFWRTLALMAAAVPIAVLTNAARVTATGVLTYYYGKQATESTFHEMSGWLVYVVALVLLAAVNVGLKKIQNLGFLFDNSKFEVQESKPETENRKSEIGNRKLNVYPLLAVLLFGGLFIHWFEQRGEVQVSRRSLRELPAQMGNWRQKGDELRFDAQTESVLRADDYTTRIYNNPDGRTVNAYVGYYLSQKSGATYHSPQNCLPGAGWTMRDPQRIEITTPAGRVFTANRYTVENGTDREVMIYWYEGRGRTAASEYVDKINTIYDSVLRRRSDGAMVRVMTSVGSDENSANRAALDLAASLEDNLPEFIPQ